MFLAREWVISYVKNPLRVERDNIVAGDPKDFLSPGYIHAWILCRVVEDDDYTLHAIPEIRKFF